MFCTLYALRASAIDTLIEVAREFSPRIEVCGPREVVLDVRGLERLFGDAMAIATALRRAAADRSVGVRVAIAGTRTATRLLVHDRPGITVIAPGTEAAALAPLPIGLLADITGGADGPNDVVLTTVRRWGLRTLGEYAALPSGDLAARLGYAGVAWQRLARGEDERPLLPTVSDERFEQALDLEWPIEGLEPLSFVLGRLLEPLSAHLERRGRGVAVLFLRLHLVTRVVHERALQLPTPIREARALRTLALLDLESHPPAAAIDRVVVTATPTAERVVQYSLLQRPLPSPEQLSTLMARLDALMGAGRCGSPVEVDSWQPGACAMKPFGAGLGIRDPGSGTRGGGPGARGSEFSHSERHTRVPSPESRIPSSEPRSPTVALRRLRFPVPARVRMEKGMPICVATERRGFGGGRVERCAGPWRTSGGWWANGAGGERSAHVSSSSARIWDHDEWDVTLTDGATYRLCHERTQGRWFIEGIVD